MGTLVAWRYPTKLFAELADHTYVACGNGGKAWSCWGGKTGGTELRRGSGSTLRADAIAEPDERANIKCYLVNGVCHQAANRILLPAEITVVGAKGYWVSEALYGTYGRPRGVLGFCRAPFHRHPTVTGELPACAETAPVDAGSTPEAEVPEPAGMDRYLSEAASLYREAEPRLGVETMDATEVRSFQMTLFEKMSDFKLGPEFRESSEGRAVMEVRGSLEHRREELEAAFFEGEMKVEEFVREYNALTVELQRQLAETLDEKRYRTLLGEAPQEPVVLGDPRIAAIAYPEKE